MALGTDYLIRYLADIKGAVQGAKQIEQINANVAKNIQAKYGEVNRIIGDIAPQSKISPITSGQFAGLNQEILKTGQIVQTVNGSFLELSKTQTIVGGQIRNTAVNVKDVTSQFVKTNLEAAKGNKVFTNLSDNIKQLAGRALLTIPIWIALRGAIMGVFSGISGGIKDLITFDLSLQKIRNNLQGTPEKVASDFKKMRASITEASKATGISTEELAKAVKEFATLGFSAEESLQGALGAAKLSIALFGDAGETAGAFARALNILIDRSAGAKTAVDQMNEAFALTSQLEETNNFEIKNVTEALDKFGGTAAGVGLTLNQTLAILAALGTAGRRGSEGATLLSTSFNQLLSNIPKISKSLGLIVGAGDSTFDTFTRILDKITELNNTPGGQPAAVEAIGDIFGGAKGIKIVQSLVAVKDILDANLKTLPSFQKLNDKVARTLESESKQAQILGNNLKEISKSFITAIAGTEDFTSALVKLNSVVRGIGEGLKPLGSTIKAIFDNLGFIAGAAFLLKWRSVVTVGALTSALLSSQRAFSLAGGTIAIAFSKGILTGFRVIGKLAFGSLVGAFTVASTAGASGVVAATIAALFSPLVIGVGLIGKLSADAFTENFIRGVQEKSDAEQLRFQKILDGLKGNLSISDLQVLVGDIVLKQQPGNALENKTFRALQAQLLKQFNAQKLTISPTVDVEPVIAFEEQQSISKLLLANKIDELKLQGATNSQIAKATILGTKQLDIKEDTLSLLKQELDLEKAIKEEKRLQNRLGSDSIKLFEIAQTEGVQVAKEIGDVLAKNVDFSSFAQRGGRAFEVFKTQFEDLFKQQQAEQFLITGDRVSGLPDLRGGTDIAIQEEALRRVSPLNRTGLQTAQQRAEQQFQKLGKIETNVPVTLNTTIDVSNLKEVQDKVVNEITQQLPKVGSEVNKALTQALQNSPTVTKAIDKKIEEF